MGGQMKKVFTLNGKIINVGEWDYCVVREQISENPFLGDGEHPEDWDFNFSEFETVTNPLPEGAIEEMREIVQSAKGRILLDTDWKELRADAYPSTKDQLDAMWKGGEEAENMAAIVRSVKEKYPAPKVE